MKFIFHPEALQEYEEATSYYCEISKNLAISFIRSVEKGIKKIIELPEAWLVVEEDVRRHLIKRFPFGIYYVIEDDYILILAVMHMSRKPGYWKNRLGEKNTLQLYGEKTESIMNDNFDLDNVTIRRFTIDDYQDVIALWKECELPLKTKGRDHIDKIRKEITKDTAHFLVAEIQNENQNKKTIIGTVLATHDGRKGWINRLAVSPNFQHYGLAQRLLKEAEDALHSLDIEIIACFIEEYNTHSMKFFKKAGYIHHPTFYYFTKRKHPDV